MTDAKPRRLQDLHAAAYNPRRASKKRQAMLQGAMQAFGDLGGIVFNRHADGRGVLISGHQRVTALRRDPDARLVLTARYDEPTANGTVAEGHVESHGERFAYREVAWGDGPKERLANLAANKSAGAFDATKLASGLEHLSRSNLDLTLAMFEVDELRGYLPDVSQLASHPAPEPPAATERQPAPERLRGPTVAGDAPQAEAHDAPNIVQVPLYFRQPDHAEFVALVGRVKQAVEATNVSDVVLAALRAADEHYNGERQ